MNVALVSKYLGVLFFLLGLSMLPPLAWGFLEFHLHQHSAGAFFAFVGGICMSFFIGLTLIFLGRKSQGEIDKREAFFLVSSSWFVGSFLAALPFWFWALMNEFSANQDRTFLNFTSCYFEAMSGLTTTGATVLSKIETIPTLAMPSAR